MQTHTLTPEVVKIIYDDRGEPFAEIVHPVLPVSDLLKFRNIRLGHYLQQFSKDMVLEKDGTPRSCRR